MLGADAERKGPYREDCKLGGIAAQHTYAHNGCFYGSPDETGFSTARSNLRNFRGH
jgi:hypothetical protein